MAAPDSAADSTDLKEGRGRLSAIRDFEGYSGAVLVPNEMSRASVNVGSQLSFCVDICALNQPISRSPEQPGCDSQNDGEERNDCFGILVNKLPQTRSEALGHYKEIGSTLLKAVGGLLVIMLSYAALKRW